MDERENVLGFRPQNETIYNKLLPYSDTLDEDSSAVLSEIKANIGRSVQLRDLKFGTEHWVHQLTRYIRLYGLKFSKEDHIAFIHLLYELTVTPDLELSLVQKFATQLSRLLKKKQLLSSKDLTLQWRPLYKLLHSVLYSPFELHGLELFPVNIKQVLKDLVIRCRVYFPIESTQEMLDEWRPLLCPFDISVIEGLQFMELFLPTHMDVDKMAIGFRLWFKELMDMWDSFQSNPSWEKSIVSLMARLASGNIGYIDWSPYITKVFTRLLRSFNLPVGTKMVQVNRASNHTDIEPFVVWIVSMIGGVNNVQDHIDKLFQTLQTFYHPSNLGKWNIKLSGLLMSFPIAFVRRINRERYRKPTWLRPVPDTHKLTENDITRFVESMKNTVFMCMFSKYGSQDSAVALRHLSTMRPELIVPPLLEKMKPALETLIEPHRLIACMNCVVSVARSMMNASKWYPEGRLHVLPLLILALPGIDPNDFKKCLVTFQMISTFVSHVPIVDCSEAPLLRSDLTDAEIELCSHTAQFEDFVLQFVDRVFALIENSTQEHVHGNQDRLNPEQAIIEKALASTFTSVLQQCSTPIYMSALKRLHEFITSSVYESKVGGRFAANLVRAAQQVNPQEALKMFLNQICDSILGHIHSHDDNLSAEQLDDEFLWNLLMFSQLLRCDGSKLVLYKEKITEVLSYILRLKCVQGYEIAGKALTYVLRSLTLIHPMSYSSVSGSLDRPLTEYLAIRDWAKLDCVDELVLDWHTPSQEEITFVQELVDRFLQSELVTIKQISQENVMQREELLRRLNIILECLGGAGEVFPMWDGPCLSIVKSQVPLKRFGCARSCGNHYEVKVGGENVRMAVLDAIRPLLNYMIASSEDDTKGLQKILRIYEKVLFFHGTTESDFDLRWKSFHTVKKALEDKMRGGKRHLRALLVDRALLQHQIRSLQKTNHAFTAKHHDLLQDLYTLSISRYSQIRKLAQNVLFQHFHYYPYSYRAVVDQIVAVIQNKNSPEHQFKGALYILWGTNKHNITTKRNWDVMGKLWPALAAAQFSEKPSILNLIDQIINKTVKNIESTAINIKVSDSCLLMASRLLDTKVPAPSQGPCTTAEMQLAVQYESSTNINNQRMYEGLVTNLVQLIKGGSLTWKFSQIALELAILLLRHDTAPPACLVDLVVQYCVHESLYMRKISLGGLLSIEKQLKRPHVKIKVDPYQQCKNTNVNDELDCKVLRPGDRPDNSWHTYNSSELPDTQEKWEGLLVVEKTHLGYYTWSKDFWTYAPHPEQPKLNRSQEEMSEVERIVYNAFMNPDYVSKLVEFLALEENKGKDRIRHKIIILFKGLFRNYGDCMLQNFKPHIERLISDTSHDKHDSSQRCSMEILAGILRGSKHWTYQQTRQLWEWAVPLLKIALGNLTVSTLHDWGEFFTVISESRDPRKIYWLFEMLIENPLSGEGGSFGDSGRLIMMQNAFLQQEWRISDLQHRLVKYLQPHLAHTYKNVRDSIGSLLSDVYILDYKMFSNSCTREPTLKAFIEYVAPQLNKFKDMVIEEAQLQNGGSVETSAPKLLESGVEQMGINKGEEESDERKQLARLCKTVMKCISNCVSRSFISAPADVFHLLPIMCTLESESKDEELKQHCSVALACISQALLQPEVIPVMFNSVKTVMRLQSWHARCTVLNYIQVMVFCNFFTMQEAKCQENIKETVMYLIRDDKLEVREMASITLGGLLQCGYIDMDKDMLGHFERLSSTKINKCVKTENIPVEKLIQRHAGVLGLSAYVQAYPYEVPEFMPQILMDLSAHVNDPQPIQMTVKKTLSNFRRTHHDNWHDHKLVFTDDQLVILTDLLVSPNYYA